MDLSGITNLADHLSTDALGFYKTVTQPSLIKLPGSQGTILPGQGFVSPTSPAQSQSNLIVVILLAAVAVLGVLFWKR